MKNLKKICFLASLLIINISNNKSFCDWTNVPISPGYVLSLASKNIGTNTTLILAGTSQAGVFVSVDGAEKWQLSNSGLKNLTIYSIIVKSDGKIFAGTAMKGIFKSEDDGATWEDANNALTKDKSVSSLAEDAAGNIYAGTLYGVFKSNNNGNSWNDITNNSLTNKKVTALIVLNGYLFAGTDEGIFNYQINGGNGNWTKSTGLSINEILSLMADGDVIYAGGKGKIFKSNGNNYNSWNNFSTGLPSGNNKYVYSIIKRTVNNNLVCGFVDESNSNNSGVYYYNQNTWSAVYIEPGNKKDTYCLKEIDGRFYTGNDGFVSKLEQAVIKPKKAGMNPFATRALTLVGNKLYAGSYGAGVFISNENRVNFSGFSNGLNNYNINTLASIGRTIFAGTDGGGVYKLHEVNTRWDEVNNAQMNNNSRVFALYTIGNTLYAGLSGGKRILKTTDEGSSWTVVNGGLPGNLSVYAFILKGSDLFAGTSKGIYKLTNQGGNWEISSNGIPVSESISCFALQDNKMLSGSGNGTLYISDDGQSWNSFFSPNANSIQSVITDRGRVLTGHDGSVAVTENGIEFAYAHRGLPPFPNVYSLLIRPNFNIYAALDNYGLWELSVADLHINIEIKGSNQAIHSSRQSANSLVLIDDTLNIYLVKAAPMFEKVDSTKILISELQSGTFAYFEHALTNNYYVIVKGKNILETWSRTGGDSLNLMDTLQYDFTTSQSQAYGNNLTYIEGDWCIYSGDVNQDGVIDCSDCARIDNAAFNYTTEFVPEDLNYDGIVDGSDYVIVNNNAYNYVTVQKP